MFSNSHLSRPESQRSFKTHHPDFRESDVKKFFRLVKTCRKLESDGLLQNARLLKCILHPTETEDEDLYCYEIKYQFQEKPILAILTIKLRPINYSARYMGVEVTNHIVEGALNPENVVHNFDYEGLNKHQLKLSFYNWLWLLQISDNPSTEHFQYNHGMRMGSSRF